MHATLAALAPHVLHAYWGLATLAALVAALPITGMQGFRYAYSIDLMMQGTYQKLMQLDLSPA